MKLFGRHLATGVASGQRGRVARPGLGRAPARARPARRTALAGASLAVASLAVGSTALAGCGTHHDPYGAQGFHPTFPAFLPSKSLRPATDRVLVGTAAKPALTVQGDAVEVKTPAWSATVQVSGPVVPGEGLPYQTAFTTCTWTVTMSHATAPVPIALADFDSTDHLGTLYHLTFVQGQPVPPRALAPGRTVTFEVRAHEAVGEGLMRWAPTDRRIVAMWDYEVEND